MTCDHEWDVCTVIYIYIYKSYRKHMYIDTQDIQYKNSQTLRLMFLYVFQELLKVQVNGTVERWDFWCLISYPWKSFPTI